MHVCDFVKYYHLMSFLFSLFYREQVFDTSRETQTFSPLLYFERTTLAESGGIQ